MSEIEDIKWLREQTGAGIMDARRALQDAGGDREKAVKLLEQRGAAKAAKRGDRAASQGVVEPYIHAGGQIGVLVELNSETDFVSRTPEFKELAHEVALQIAATDPKYRSVDDIPEADRQEMQHRFVQEALADGKPDNIAQNIAQGKFKKYAEQVALLEQPYVRDDSKTVRQLLSDLSSKTGENIVLRRYARFQVGA